MIILAKVSTDTACTVLLFVLFVGARYTCDMLCTLSPPKHTHSLGFTTIVEMVVLIVCIVVVFVMGLTISIGLAVTCKEVRQHYDSPKDKLAIFHTIALQGSE